MFFLLLSTYFWFFCYVIRSFYDSRRGCGCYSKGNKIIGAQSAFIAKTDTFAAYTFNGLCIWFFYILSLTCFPNSLLITVA